MKKLRSAVIQKDLGGVVISRDATKEFNLPSTNPTKWSNTLKYFVGNSRRIV